MIEFKNVTVRLAGKTVLKNVTFAVLENTLTALLGRNGSGKSTLIKCLNGEIRYSGEILLDGRNIKAISAKEKATMVSVLPQLLPDSPFTVEELVSLGRKPYQPLTGRLNGEHLLKVEQAIEKCGLSALRKKKINAISGGEKQRAFLAMILAQDTKYIVLDEATTYMDAVFENETYRILEALLLENGKTVLAVFHNLTRAVREAKRTVILNEGSMIFEGEISDLKNTDDIERVFGVKKTEAVTENGSEIFYY